MKKFVILLLVFVLSPCGWCFTELANEGKAGLRIRPIDRILKMDESQIDLCTAALVLSNEWGSPKTLHRYRNKVDDMAEDILEILDEKKLMPNQMAIEVINEYLYNKLGFETVETADDPDDLFLHTVLDKRRGYCLSLSVLYLSIGERIGMPLYGVVVPGHFFVRYDDGKNKYNIETTSKGGIAPDKHYIDKFKPPINGKTIYMRNLTKKQTLGCFFNNLGNSYSDVGEINNARIALERAVKINPTLGESHTNLGNIYLQEGWFDDAIDQYLLSIELTGGDAISHYNIANAYTASKEYDKSIHHYKKAILMQSDYIEAYRSLGDSYRRKKDYNKAVYYLKQAVAIDVRDAKNYKLLGDVYSEKQEYGAAIVQYEKAVAMDPYLVGANSQLGYAYLNNGRYDDAAGQFLTTLGLDGEHIRSYFGLAMSYNYLGLTEDEIEVYAAILEIEPDNAGVRQNLGSAYARLKMYDESIEQYLAAILLEPQNAMAHNAIAISFYMVEDYDSCKKHAAIAKSLGFDVHPELLKLIEN